MNKLFLIFILCLSMPLYAQNEDYAFMEQRRMPEIEKTGKFKAYYTRLKYYPGWDNVWRVGEHPDVVVSFESSPVSLVFWRGIRYGASWVSENGNWMTDQSVEAWDSQTLRMNGCFEHMQDRHCRFSHVRIIENTPARIVIHWRYAPVSSKNNTWNIDPKTGWECWIDEYYYIYPDAVAVRKVNWTTGTLGTPHQFQESLPLTHPGQKLSDLLEPDYAYIADYDGNRDMEVFTDHAPQMKANTAYTVQRYNFKSENKPFICFEPGNSMTLRDAPMASYDKYGVCDHFPVGQARCDGRTSLMGDRPAHSLGFPISYPVIHRNEQTRRSYWCGLYGMGNRSVDEIVELGRSWAFAPELETDSESLEYSGYDTSERCYKLKVKNDAAVSSAKIILKGDDKHPVMNPALMIEGISSKDVQIRCNGHNVEFKSGIIERMEGKSLMVFIPFSTYENVEFTIIFKQ